MSAPVGLDHRDGFYSKLIEDEAGADDHFTASPSSVRLSVSPRPAPAPGPGPGLGPGLGRGLGLGPGPGPGPGLFKACTVALSLLSVVLLICIISISTNKSSSGGGSTDVPQTEKQKQELNVTELLTTIKHLQEENHKLRQEINSSTVEVPPPRPSCPADWLSFNSSCYQVVSRSRSWTDAQEYCVQQGGHLAIVTSPEEQVRPPRPQEDCVQQGGHLAIVTSPEEQTFLWEQLPRGHWRAFWIGLTDAHTEDTWIWADGTPLVTSFWEEGEPNNHIDEDCGYIVKTEVLERVAIRSWYDAPCSMYWPFICESDGATKPTAATG